MTSWCYANLQLLIAGEIDCSFPHLRLLSRNLLFLFCAFSSWVVLVLLVRHFLYILDMTPLSIIYAANFACRYSNMK